jgi:hypothetical protein
VPPPKTPEEEARQERARRNNFFDVGAWPKGDRPINPKMKRTAYEYFEWTRSREANPHHIQEGAYLGMLEREEAAMGYSSYPQGHPRRYAALHGISPGAAPPGHREPSRGFSESFSGPMEELVQRAAGDQAPVRVNRMTETCARCHKLVQPGEGRMEREASGWVTYHHPECPDRHPREMGS